MVQHQVYASSKLRFFSGDLFVVGGEGTGAGSNVEVVNLDPENDIQTPCFSPQEYPFDVSQQVGTFSSGRIYTCGGSSNAVSITSCYAYEVESDTWISAGNLDRDRRVAASAMLSDTEWWITGGEDTGNVGLNTTIIYHTDTEEVEAYVDLPIGMWRHSMVKINDSAVFVIGGDNVGSPYIFDVENESFLGPFNNASVSIYLAFAGLIEKSDGTQEIVVTGGYVEPSLSFIFSLETLEWRSGPDLPQPIFSGASVPYGRSFLAVGGLEGATETNGIYTFDPDEEEWVVLNRVLTTEREDQVVVVVPPGFVECF